MEHFAELGWLVVLLIIWWMMVLTVIMEILNRNQFF